MQPADEGDISWTVLCRIARAWAGDAAELAAVRPLVGGCINTVLELSMKDGQKAVLKICAHRVTHAFAHEAFQLELLRGIGLPVPQVYSWHVGSLDEPHSYLLLEHLPGVDLHTARQACTREQYDALQEHLAELVLAIHAVKGTVFSRVLPKDASAQATPAEPRPDSPPAPNACDCWWRFFAQLHEPIIKAVEKSSLVPVKCRRHLRKIHNKLHRALPNGADEPRLVHGDLWATNLLAAANADGSWRISGMFDPACKYAHAESELAYLELFHTATPAFFHAYQHHRKLPPEYHRVRKPVYQLYSLVNHVHLFGEAYVKPMMETLERVSAVV